MMILFAVDLHILPISGAYQPSSIILPAFTLGSIQAAIIARLVRNNMLDVARQDYVRTARAKGLTNRTIALKHTLRNALIPVVTILGIQFGFLLAGSYVIEEIFAWPGIGKTALDAFLSKDFPLAQGAILVTCLTFIVVNLCIDILYAYLDPHVRYVETKPGA